MRVLLVAATDLEIAPLLGRFTPASRSLERVASFTSGSRHVDILTTGVGMIATAAHCARALAQERYDLAVNLGVCGSFDAACPPGTVVNVTTDGIPELGAEDGEAFLTIQELGLLRPDDPPFTGGRLVNPDRSPHPVIGALRAENGITVNTVHGMTRSPATSGPSTASSTR